MSLAVDSMQPTLDRSAGAGRVIRDRASASAPLSEHTWGVDLERPIDRRGFLVVGAGLLVAGVGCSSDPATPGGPRRSSSQDTRPESPSVTTPRSPDGPASHLPDVTPWTPRRGDLRPAIKTQAVRVIEALGTWSTGSAGALAAKRRLVELGQPARLVDEAGPLLLGAHVAALEVVEVQYAGLLRTTAGVLVVCRQWRAAPDGPVTSTGTTVVVRLSRDGARWRVTGLDPARPHAPAPVVSALAGRVLAQPRIDLPAAARADVLAGDVHNSVLTALLRLATRYRIGVSVIRSGHPVNVFGTDRVSDHARGRAFDTWQIDGRPVVDPTTPRDLVVSYMFDAVAAGASNIGGPYQLSGEGASFFTDAAHHDHIHTAFAG